MPFKMQIMSTKKRSRVEGSVMPRYIIHPYSLNYHMWLWLTCAAAIWTGKTLGSDLIGWHPCCCCCLDCYQ